MSSYSGQPVAVAVACLLAQHWWVEDRHSALFKLEHAQPGFVVDLLAAVQILMNNCYADDAVVGARQLAALLHGEDPDAAAQVQRPGS